MDYSPSIIIQHFANNDFYIYTIADKICIHDILVLVPE